MRVCSVPYYNTLPLTCFLGAMFDDLELTTGFPSSLANGLHQHAFDLAMMPVGSLIGLENAAIVSDACIGSDGPVESVLMFSRKPLEKIESIALDNDSRSSIILGQIILREFYNNKTFEKVSFSRQMSPDIVAADACLIIGDRALTYEPDRTVWPYRFDLGELWFEKTGLPFVFAAWTTTQSSIVENVVVADALQQSRDLGVMHFETIAKTTVEQNIAAASLFPYPISYERLLAYYRNNIVYTLTNEHRKGMNLYFELGKMHKLF